MPDDKSGPLAGYRILDMTSVVLGPYATQILGDLGADVVKLESPQGDVVRRTDYAAESGFGTLFMTLNRNKRSVVLDLKMAGAAGAMHALLRWADVFIHNVRPHAMQRLGLSYEEVCDIRPNVVYVHAVGFDSDGPYSGLPAYDDTIQSVSGATALMTLSDGDPQPRNIPTLVADKTTGLHAVYAILAALLHRERTGEGQQIEVPMFESTVSFLMPEHMGGTVWQPPLGPPGYTRTSHKFNRPLRTKDGCLGFMPYADQHWRDILTIGGREDLFDDPRLADVSTRRSHMAELGEILEEITLQRTTKEWCELLTKHDIPFMWVNTLETLQEDPHLSAVDFFPSYPHQQSQHTYVTMRHPVKFSLTPATVRAHPPRLGQHGREVLTEAGLSGDEISELARRGILQGTD